MTTEIEYFQQELNAMRGAVDAFSQAYPAVANELRLSAGHSADPHVEQLIQSFVWLSSQLRADLEQQKQEIPNHLLLSLYPHLIHSIPSMAVMQGNVLADGANFVNGYTLEKGRLFSIWSTERRGAEGSEKRPVECRLQCCYDTAMWPLNIDDIAVKPKNLFDFLDDRNDVNGVISLKLSSYGTDPIYEYPLDRLRFFIADPQLRTPLHQILSNNLLEIAVRCGDKIIPLPKAGIHWLGFGETENVLPQPLGTHNAYRLLQEYFYFPEKFYFFDIAGIDVCQASDKFELLLILNDTSALPPLKADSLMTNCFPAINLFPATFKPIQLDHSIYEYRVIANEAQYGQSEVHSVNQVRMISSDGKVHHADPWLGGTSMGDSLLKSHLETIGASELRYLTRIVPPLTPGISGCDTMISLYDESFSAGQPVDQTLSAKGLCSNRNLPESLRVGNTLKLLGAGAMADAKLVSRPSLFKGAKLEGEANVKLLSQLHLNQLSLASVDSKDIVLKRLKQLLNLYCDPMTASHRLQVEGIVDMSTEASVRRMGADAWRGHYQGTTITLTIEENNFNGANPLLLGEVLSHFFGLYTTLNHFVQLKFVSYKREGVWQQWPPRIGEQIIL